LKAWGLPPELL
jgi:hypothetical protein